jgi:hypothetical protein
MENKEKIKYNVKGLKTGRMYAVPDPIDEDDLDADERELLNNMAGMDPHFWGPGYDE